MTKHFVTTLGAICDFRYGKPLPAEARRGGQVAVYGSNGVVGHHDEPLVRGPSIIIGRKGSFGEVHYCATDSWPIDTTYFIDVSATKTDLKWLSYALKASRLKDLNRAAAVPGLNRNDAYRLPISVPPLDEQRRIAAILDKADALRQKRKGAIALLDSLTPSIFIEMFGDPLGNPRRWTQLPLGKICDVVTGNTPSRANTSFYGSEIEWIKSDNINSDQLYVTRAAESLSVTGKELARLAPAGSTLVTCIAGSPNSIGNAAMTDRLVAFNQQINALIPRDVDPMFLYAHLKVGKRLVQDASTGGMKGLVSKSRLQSVEILHPPMEKQREFSWKLRAAATLKTKDDAQLHKLETSFASLQHRAFSGQL